MCWVVDKRQINKVEAAKDGFDRPTWKVLKNGIKHIQNAMMRASSENHQTRVLSDNQYQLVFKTI